MLALLLACAPGPSPQGRSPSPWTDDSAPPAPVGEAAEALGASPTFWETDRLWTMEIELSAEAIAQLALSPTDYVPGAFILDGRRFEPVGVRLKGNSTFQPLDARPALKIKADEYVPGARIWGLERITLNSNYWDASMMAETLAYGLWRRAGAPAPRTAYANVSVNGALKGLYTVVEAMDDDFVDANWPGSEGGLYEMCRSCDLNLDCAAYPLQETGTRFDPTGLPRACAAAASGEEAQIRAHFDWAQLTRYFALERVANHADSYAYNRNNHYLYHNPDTDQVTLSPWGADSTFSYSYPPDEVRPCEPGLFDNLHNEPGAYLATWCRNNAACWSDVKAEMLRLADLIEEERYADEVGRIASRIEASVAADPTWPWGLSTWESRRDCFATWIADRPAQVRDFVAAH